MLIAASFYSIFLTNEIGNKIKQKFVINIFLEDTVSVNSLQRIKSNIETKTFILSIYYISKEEAAEIFIKETGEDFRQILDYNPIPASFSIQLKSEFVERDSIEAIKKQLSLIPGIDEIMFQHDILEKFVTLLKKVQKYIFILTGILILISVYITYSTIKLVISFKQEELETMKLVGAKLSTIKMPIILNEIFTGIFASFISLVIIKFLFTGISKYFSFSFFSEPPLELLVLILVIGPAIGFFVSTFILRKITLKI
jgi:cell division transport system permease protein